MLTPQTRSLVSAVALATALIAALGACAGGPAPAAWDGVAAAPEPDPTIRFDNDAQVDVDVFLVTPLRQWRLGRVGPGARAMLRIPAAALTESPTFVRLAVVEGTPMSVQGGRDPRAILTIPQPAAVLLTQQWTFYRRQLGAPEIRSMRADVGRP